MKESTKMMFNLDTLGFKDSAEVHLRHPVEDTLLYADEAKKKPVKIDIWGTASKEYRTAVNALQNRQLKRGKKVLTAEQMREEDVELLVACSIKAHNLSYKGMAVDTPEVFRMLYSDDKYTWLKTQVNDAMSAVENFIQA